MPPSGLAAGQQVHALVLDVDPVAGILDLSACLKPPKARSTPAAGTSLEAKVELIKDDYAVVSVAKHGIGFLAWAGVNGTQTAHPPVLQLGTFVVSESLLILTTR